MKYSPRFLIVFLIFIMASCVQKGNKVLITEKIQYDVLIKSPDPSYDRWIQNIEDSKRIKFIKSLLDAAYQGRMEAYDYFGKPMSMNELKSIGADTMYKTLMRNYPPYAEYDTVIITKLELEDINKVRFIEEWYMDESTMEIEKNVVAIAPVMDKYDENGDFLAFQPLFWLYLNKEYFNK